MQNESKSMPYLVVCPLSHVKQVVDEYKPSAMISLLSSDQSIERPKTIIDKMHLLLNFNDIQKNTDGLISPAYNHIENLLNFVKKWDQESPLLIHCWMGISRSTAAAYMIANALNPTIDENSWADILRQRASEATPNALMIALADKVLNRQNRMISAIENIGRGQDAFEGKPFTLHLD